MTPRLCGTPIAGDPNDRSAGDSGFSVCGGWWVMSGGVGAAVTFGVVLPGLLVAHQVGERLPGRVSPLFRGS